MGEACKTPFYYGKYAWDDHIPQEENVRKVPGASLVPPVLTSPYLSKGCVMKGWLSQVGLWSCLWGLSRLLTGGPVLEFGCCILDMQRGT